MRVRLQEWVFIAQVLNIGFQVAVELPPPLFHKDILLRLVADEVEEIGIVRQRFAEAPGWFGRIRAEGDRVKRLNDLLDHRSLESGLFLDGIILVHGFVQAVKFFGSAQHVIGKQ